MNLRTGNAASEALICAKKPHRVTEGDSSDKLLEQQCQGTVGVASCDKPPPRLSLPNQRQKHNYPSQWDDFASPADPTLPYLLTAAFAHSARAFSKLVISLPAPAPRAAPLWRAARSDLTQRM